MIAKPLPARLPAIDAIKALASQLIVWHHLAFYGPMSDVVHPAAPGVVGWFSDQARIAVQAFLVVAGFLAAKALLPQSSSAPAGTPPLRPLLWRRYIRLLRPYLVALAVAIGSAALARGLVANPTFPAPPTVAQILAHVLLLQDVLGIEALSAGVWYVAIDFQLYALLVLLLWIVRPLADAFGADPAQYAFAACAALTAASLAWINRQPGLDVWAPYFFGAYGLGILAQWISARGADGARVLLLAALVIAALLIEWRSRVLVAGLTALLLVWSDGGQLAPRWARGRSIAFLGRISYSLFLIHYPVCLIVGALIFARWPESIAINAAGMIGAWLLSIGAAAVLHRLAEAPATAG